MIQSSARLRTSYSTRLNTKRGSVGDGSGGKDKSGQDMVKSFIDEKLLLLNRQKEALKSERDSFYEEKNEILSAKTKLETDRQKFEIFKERELSKLEKSQKEFKRDKGAFLKEEKSKIVVQEKILETDNQGLKGRIDQ